MAHASLSMDGFNHNPYKPDFKLDWLNLMLISIGECRIKNKTQNKNPLHKPFNAFPFHDHKGRFTREKIAKKPMCM